MYRKRIKAVCQCRSVSSASGALLRQAFHSVDLSRPEASSKAIGDASSWSSPSLELELELESRGGPRSFRRLTRYLGRAGGGGSRIPERVPRGLSKRSGIKWMIYVHARCDTGTFQRYSVHDMRIPTHLRPHIAAEWRGRHCIFTEEVGIGAPSTPFEPPTPPLHL